MELGFLFILLTSKANSQCFTSSPAWPPASQDYYSGYMWYDTNGNSIQAHGGGFLKVGGTWYWYGESAKTSDLSNHEVTCYSSTDLFTWKYEGDVFYNQNITGVSQPGPYVIERPKVVYNQQTGKYVMWFHLDNSGYSLRMVGIATASSPNIQFDWVHAIQPDGLPSLDMTLYQDDGGSTYHIRSVNNQYVGISLLTSDYLNSAGMVSNYSQAREGPAMFKLNGYYYLITSHLTGWDANPMDMLKSNGNSLHGATWSSLGNPTDSSDSMNSQSTYVLPYTYPNGETKFIYMGDRWNYYGPGSLLNATYIWLPITVNSATSFNINWLDYWNYADLTN